MARIYTNLFLKAFSRSTSSRPLSVDVWRRLVDHGISKAKPTRRGCRAGHRKSKLIGDMESLILSNSILQSSVISSGVAENINSNVKLQEETNLHTSFSEILNIQTDTFSREQTKDPFVDDRPSITRTLQENLQDSEHNNYNVDPLPRKTVYFVPKLMVANTMSLAPKILEVQEFVLRNNVSLAFITETWLESTIADSIVDIPGYNVIRRDRSSEDHGGVCFYIKEGFSKYKKLEDLSCCNDHEILWVQLLPHRLPRGFSSLIVAALYHPHW